MDLTKLQKNEKSFIGDMRYMSQNGYDVKVRLQLLNGKVNRNNWVFENITEHLSQFNGVAILISYKNGELGAGHEMDFGKDGNPSFKSATAERIVGYIPETADVHIENIDGVDWVVTNDAVIFGWYAPELSERLKGTGTLTESEKQERSMRVSIETLIDDKYARIENGTEYYAKWKVLGVTILNDNVTEAVAGANIRALSEIGIAELREITNIRVAQAIQESAKQKNEKEKKQKMKNLNLQDLTGKFNGFTPIAVNGLSVALLSDNNRVALYKFNENEETVIPERIEMLNVNCPFGEGDEAVNVTADTLLGIVSAKCNSLQTALDSTTAENAALKEKVNALETAELNRRKEEVKEKINSRVAEIKENCSVAINECADLLTDEKLTAFANMVENGKFVGAERACEMVDSRNMSKILATEKSKKREQISLNFLHENKEKVSDTADSINRVCGI